MVTPVIFIWKRQSWRRQGPSVENWKQVKSRTKRGETDNIFSAGTNQFHPFWNVKSVFMSIEISEQIWDGQEIQEGSWDTEFWSQWLTSLQTKRNTISNHHFAASVIMCLTKLKYQSNFSRADIKVDESRLWKRSRTLIDGWRRRPDYCITIGTLASYQISIIFKLN